MALPSFTKKGYGLAIGTLLVLGAGAGITADRTVLKQKAVQPTSQPVKVVVVTPTASLSATPTVFVTPTRVYQRVVYPTTVVTKGLTK